MSELIRAVFDDAPVEGLPRRPDPADGGAPASRVAAFVTTTTGKVLLCVAAAVAGLAAVAATTGPLATSPPTTPVETIVESSWAVPAPDVASSTAGSPAAPMPEEGGGGHGNS